jgi:LuxR family maltose regulon positive regulatory protein
MLAGHLAILGRAAMALDQNDAATAADLGKRFLRTIAVEDRMERAAWSCSSEPESHSEITLGLKELWTSFALSRVPSIPTRCRDRFGAPRVWPQRPQETTRTRRPASRTPYIRLIAVALRSKQRARIELAYSLFALGRPEAAELQARDALESFQVLGATVEADRAVALLRELETSTRIETGDTLHLAGLSQREVEVLRLVAQGLSNQEIADRVVLSKHTVHRHISNILAKRDLPSRAAAATYAAQNGLL